MVSKSGLCVLALIVFAAWFTPVEVDGASELVAAVTGKLLSLWRTGQFEFLGHTCYQRSKPKIRKWKLKFDGKVWCPGLAPFSGTARRSSSSGAIEDAIRDFARQAVAKRIVSEQEVRHWIESR